MSVYDVLISRLRCLVPFEMIRWYNSGYLRQTKVYVDFLFVNI